MPIREHATYQDVRNAFEGTITADTTTEGAIFDTAEFSQGVYFALAASIYNTGTFTLKLEHGDDPALADAEDVPVKMQVYSTPCVVSALTAPGGKYVKQGVHSTKRYVRPSIVSTDTADARLMMVAILDSELMPTLQG